MKSDRVLLAEWLGDYTDSYNDIPWPLVHERAGSDAIRWLNQQDHTEVQMILEKGEGGGRTGQQRLYAEFYLPILRTEFALKFNK